MDSGPFTVVRFNTCWHTLDFFTGWSGMSPKWMCGKWAHWDEEENNRWWTPQINPWNRKIRTYYYYFYWSEKKTLNQSGRAGPINNNIGILHSLQPHWRPPCDWYQGFQLWYVGSRPCNTAKWSGNIYKCYFNRIKMLFWINNLLDEPVVSRWHSLSFLRGWESQRQNKSKLTFKKIKEKRNTNIYRWLSSDQDLYSFSLFLSLSLSLIRPSSLCNDNRYLFHHHLLDFTIFFLLFLRDIIYIYI